MHLKLVIDICLTIFCSITININNFTDNGNCKLYSAIVTSYYDPNDNVDDSPTSINAKCYSSWYFSNDITDKITAITSSPALNNWIDVYTTNGVYVINNYNIWHSLYVTNPWILYDFGKVVKIQKIIIKIRNAQGQNPEFRNVEVRVGKISASGDFSQYTLFDHYPGVAVNGEVVVFEGSKTLRGQYVSVQRLGSSVWFQFAKINILGEE